jgi:hypothetical protein
VLDVVFRNGGHSTHGIKPPAAAYEAGEHISAVKPLKPQPARFVQLSLLVMPDPAVARPFGQGLQG